MLNRLRAFVGKKTTRSSSASSAAASFSLNPTSFNTGHYWCSSCAHLWISNNGLCHLCCRNDSHPQTNRPEKKDCPAPAPHLCIDQHCQREQLNEINRIFGARPLTEEEWILRLKDRGYEISGQDP